MRTPAKSLKEVEKRLNDLTDDSPSETHKEAELLLCDALNLFRGRDKVVEAFTKAATRCWWRY